MDSAFTEPHLTGEVDGNGTNKRQFAEHRVLWVKQKTEAARSEREVNVYDKNG